MPAIMVTSEDNPATVKRPVIPDNGLVLSAIGSSLSDFLCHTGVFGPETLIPDGAAGGFGAEFDLHSPFCFYVAFCLKRVAAIRGHNTNFFAGTLRKCVLCSQ